MKATILFYTVVLSSTGGAQHTMSLLARNLVARGYEVVFFTRPPFRRSHRYVRWLSDARIRVHLLRHFDKALVARVGRLMFALCSTPLYALWRHRSIRFAWGAAGSIFDGLVLRLERRSIRGALTSAVAQAVRDERAVLLHIWGPATLTPLLLEWARQQGVPAIYHEMGEADELYVKTWELESTVAAINLATQLICVSPRVAETARRVYRYVGEAGAIADTVHDPGESSFRGRRVGPRVTLGAIGRLVPHKRHSDLVHAVKRLCDMGRDVGILIAGDGPSRVPLEALTRELGLIDRVSFTGEFEELDEVMAAFDIFVLTSSSESQCMPVTESMAYGKPVVVSDFGGIPDFVEHGVTGFLVPVGDLPALVNALRTLVDDPVLRDEMGGRGRAKYLADYTPDKITDAWERAYRRALPGGEAARGGT